MLQSITRGSFVTSTPAQLKYVSNIGGSRTWITPEGAERNLFFIAKKIKPRVIRKKCKPPVEFSASVLHDLKDYLGTYTLESLLYGPPDFLDEHATIKAIHRELNLLGEIHNIQYSLNEARCFFMKTTSCFPRFLLNPCNSELFLNSQLRQHVSLQDSSLDDGSFASCASSTKLPTSIKKLDFQCMVNSYGKFRNLYLFHENLSEYNKPHSPWPTSYDRLDNKANCRNSLQDSSLHDDFSTSFVSGTELPTPIRQLDSECKANAYDKFVSPPLVFENIREKDKSCISSPASYNQFLNNKAKCQNVQLRHQISRHDSSLENGLFTSFSTELPTTPMRYLKFETNAHNEFKSPCPLNDSSEQIYLQKPQDVDLDEHGTFCMTLSNLSKHFLENQAKQQDVSCLDNSCSSVSFYLPVRKKNFLKELDKRNCHSIVSRLLSFLSDEDLQAVSCVSRLWRKIVLQDKKSSKRKKEYLKQKRDGEYKENKSKVEAIQTRKGRVLFSEITNTNINFPEQPLTYKTSKSKYYSEVPRNLNKTAKCPRKLFPAESLIKGKYSCTRALCAYEFCTKCCGPYLADHVCSVASGEIDLPTVIVGSKESKRNLRQLRRLNVHETL